MNATTHWDEQASNWTAWAREPGHDSYWHYRDALLDFIPAAEESTLDVGCGEGRVSRDLTAHGHTVTSVDTSAALLAAAREAHPEGSYLHADAADLPFPDGRFDLVVSYNMLMDVPDPAAVAREMARVLRPGGTLCASVVHPIADAQQFMDGDYLNVRRFSEEVERDGLRMVFDGWRRPLSAYTRALEDAGLIIEALREPAHYQAPDVPLFLWLRAGHGQEHRVRDGGH